MATYEERGDIIMAKRPATEVSILEILLSVPVIAIITVMAIYLWYTATHDQPPNILKRLRKAPIF